MEILLYRSTDFYCTFSPSSQLIHKSPLVKKQATAWRAKWWIQPSLLSWVMMASIKGYPVRACDETNYKGPTIIFFFFLKETEVNMVFECRELRTTISLHCTSTHICITYKNFESHILQSPFSTSSNLHIQKWTLQKTQKLDLSKPT